MLSQTLFQVLVISSRHVIIIAVVYRFWTTWCKTICVFFISISSFRVFFMLWLRWVILWQRSEAHCSFIVVGSFSHDHTVKEYLEKEQRWLAAKVGTNVKHLALATNISLWDTTSSSSWKSYISHRKIVAAARGFIVVSKHFSYNMSGWNLQFSNSYNFGCE